MPFSSLLGSVTVSVIALILLWQRWGTISHRLLNRGLVIVTSLFVLSALQAYHPVDALLGLANFLPLFIVFAALSELIQTPAQLRRLAWILVLTSVPVVVVGLGQQFWGWAGEINLWGLVNWSIAPTGNPPGRMSSLFFYANVLASYLTVTLILSLGLWAESLTVKLSVPSPRVSLYQQVFLAFVVLLNGAALILTNSRNAWAIALLACFAYALYLGWRWLVAGVTGVAAVILGAAFAPSPLREGLRAIVPAFFWARLTDQMYPNRPLAELRTTQWQFAWSLTQQRPWLGWGLRNFNPLYEQQMHFFIGHPHNLLLMLTAETGLPATLLFVGLIGWMMGRAVMGMGRNQHQGKGATTGEYAVETRDRLMVFIYLTAFSGCTLFHLLDITLFDIRINFIGWLLLAAICGWVYHSPAHSKPQTQPPTI